MEAGELTLQRWMKLALAGAGALNIAVAVATLGFYHELFRLLGLTRPASLWPLQSIGFVIGLLGVSYCSLLQQPRRWRFVAGCGLVAQAALACLLVLGVRGEKLPPACLWLAIASTPLYLVPLAAIALHLMRAARPQIHTAVTCAANGANETPTSARHRGQPGLSFQAAVVLLVVLPTAVSMAQISSEWLAQRRALQRPPGWSNINSRLPRSVGEEYPFAFVETWPQRRFTDPTFLTEYPDGSGRLVIVERPGRVLLVEGSPAAHSDPEVLLDISHRTMQVDGKFEDGLLSVAFHPQFADASSPHRGRLFVRYTSHVGGRSNRLSEFVVPAGSVQAEANGERVLIEMPEKTAVHKGGGLAFGPDGFLYTTFGTDGRRFPHEHSQRIDRGLFAGVLRLDVDCRGGALSHPPPRQPTIGKTAHYFIPHDNPFVGRAGALEEFYALGFRNPWRLSIDRATGGVWVGDVGDRRREEINFVAPGSNHGFDFLEGSLATQSFDALAPPRPASVIGVETAPVHEYERDSIQRCVIGGYIYRGRRLPHLQGKYVFADLGGRVFALTLDERNSVVNKEAIAVVRVPGHGVSSLGEDAAGELYLCWLGDLGQRNGRVFHLSAAQQQPHERLPATLAETGLLAGVQPLAFDARLIPYEVNAPLWSDRAIKRRFIGLASAAKIAGRPQDRWIFPPGTIFVKHFDLPLDERETAENETSSTTENDGAARDKLRRLETRILVCDDRSGVFGASYRWNAERTAARLVDFAETEKIEYIDRDGRTQTQTWLYPGRFDCLTCHNDNAGGVLGFSARQLNKECQAGGLRENQLARFAQAGMFQFECPPDAAAAWQRLVALDDETASVTERVRSYVDANCAHCHQPGSRFGGWDGRYSTPLAQQKIIEGTAFNHRGDDPAARIVAPGDLAKSFLHVRLSSNDRFLRMPPLGRDVMHEAAARLVAQWIREMLAEDE